MPLHVQVVTQEGLLFDDSDIDIYADKIWKHMEKDSQTQPPRYRITDASWDSLQKAKLPADVLIAPYALRAA